MKTRIATGFGLALMLVLGVIATMFLLNPQAASATVGDVLATADTTTARNTVSVQTITWKTTEDYAAGFVAEINFPGTPTTGTVTPTATVTGNNVVHAVGTGATLAAARTDAIANLPGTGGGDGSPAITSVAAGTNTVSITGNSTLNPADPKGLDGIAGTADDVIVVIAVRFLFDAGIINPINDTGDDFVALDTNQGAEAAAAPVNSPDIVFAIPAGVAASTGLISPSTAGDLSEHTFTFTTSQALPANTGEVRITFDKDKGIPAAIASADVLMSSDLLIGITEDEGTCTGADDGTGGADQVVPLQRSPSFDDDNLDPRRTVIILKVPDMNPSTGTGSCGAGVQGIAANARVTVIITTGAGVTNQTEGGTEGTELVACATACIPGVNTIISNPVGEDTVAIHSVGLRVTRDLKLSTVNGGRGTKITVVGRGFKDRTTATVWLDANADNVRDATETELASNIVVGRDDTFTATFIVTNPPFTPGQNTIAAQDGRNNRAPIADLPLFELRGSVSVTPPNPSLGDTITVQLKDFDTTSSLASAVALAGTDINGAAYAYGGAPSLRLGGVTVTVPATAITDVNGEVTFTTTVPNRVALGVQALEVRNLCCLRGAGPISSTRRTNLSIGGATLILTPDAEIMPNQTLNVVGNDYTQSDLAATVLINEVDASQIPLPAIALGCTTVSSITIEGVAIARALINEGQTISVAGGGNWSASVIIPVTTNTTTAGSYQLKVTDCQGREGVATITIPTRTLTLNPVAAQVGTQVTVIGTGFPVKNDRTGAPSVTTNIVYDAGGGNTSSVSVQADASGNINTTLRVPTNANIPSTNTVDATFTLPGTQTQVITTITHDVPRATLNITPTGGLSGTTVTVVGSGFKGFTAVTSLEIGANIDVLPSPKPSTDRSGGFTASFLVPQLDSGVQNVEAVVGGVTASASFTVQEVVTTLPTGPVVLPSAPAEAFAELIANNDNLLRVWYFDPATQDVAPDFGWFLYDPRPVFALANTVTEIVSGRFYWVNVREAQTALLGGVTRTLFAGWNPLTW